LPLLVRGFLRLSGWLFERWKVGQCLLQVFEIFRGIDIYLA
jgi:hypothetical protein